MSNSPGFTHKRKARDVVHVIQHEEMALSECPSNGKQTLLYGSQHKTSNGIGYLGPVRPTRHHWGMGFGSEIPKNGGIPVQAVAMPSLRRQGSPVKGADDVVHVLRVQEMGRILLACHAGKCDQIVQSERVDLWQHQGYRLRSNAQQGVVKTEQGVKKALRNP